MSKEVHTKHTNTHTFTNIVLNIDIGIAFQDHHSHCFYMPSNASVYQPCPSKLITYNRKYT